MQPPRTRYARSGDVSIAFQVMGNSPIDLIHVPPFISNLELQWQNHNQARYFRRLASFSRLIMFDKRGTGLSDRTGIASLEERMDDVRAVMDEVGSERAAVFGSSEGGAMALLFAATYPERVPALILYGAYPRLAAGPDYPDGLPYEVCQQAIETVRTRWGEGVFSAAVADPSGGADQHFVEEHARWERLSASPGAAVALLRMIFELDVRHLLPVVHVPTLVIYRAADMYHAVGSRYLGAHISGAKTVELPGNNYLPHLGDQEAILGEIEEFLTGQRPVPELERVLATVLFTDIVDATRTAVEHGDRTWRELLEVHHAVVREELERFRGREIDTAGDGFFAAFDGPARAVRAAVAIATRVHGLGIDVRAGVHTGECEVMERKLSGLAVHIGARVAALAGPGEVLVSNTVKDLVAGSGLKFRDCGMQSLKGVPGTWQLYSVERP
jgi:class 3 adenylate cyclase